MANHNYKAKCIDVETSGVRIVVLNKEDASDLDVSAMDRVMICKGDECATAIVDLTETFVSPGEIGLFKEVCNVIPTKDGDSFTVKPKEKPESISYIKKKLNGETLNENEIKAIINNLMNEELSDIELTSWISAVYIRGLEKSETIALTNAIVNSGGTLNLNSKRIFDKHSIGGVAGNRTTLLIVPIIAAAGLVIPKTSSRAITSPAGTPDTMEVLAPVSLEKEEIERMVNKCGACLIWGGAVNLAAADDKLIKIRHPLSLDPQGMLLASILAKKKAVGATDVIIDLPIGEGAKLPNMKEAEILATQFTSLGKELDMNVHSIITDGDHPIGLAVGPAMEARETLRILAGESVSPELTRKSVELAGLLLEYGGISQQGKGAEVALNLIKSGAADKKFRQIIELQGGDPNIKPDDVKLGQYTHVVESEETGRIDHINNRGITAIARAAGNPKVHEAGMYLHVEEGDKIKKGQGLFTLYANTERKLDQALVVYEKYQPIRMARIILEID